MDKSQFNRKTGQQKFDAVKKTDKPVPIRSDPAIYTDKLLDTKEATELLKGVLPNKLYYHCKRGRLPHIWQNGKLFFSAALLVVWHRSLKQSKQYQSQIESDGNNRGVQIKSVCIALMVSGDEYKLH